MSGHILRSTAHIKCYSKTFLVCCNLIDVIVCLFYFVNFRHLSTNFMIRFSRNIFYLSQQCTASKWHFLYQENSRRDGTDFVQYLVKITDGRITFLTNTREGISFLLEGSLSDWPRHQNCNHIHHKWSITVWWSYLTHSGGYWTQSCTFRRLVATQTIGQRLFCYSPIVEVGKDGFMPHSKKK